MLDEGRERIVLMLEGAEDGAARALQEIREAREREARERSPAAAPGEELAWFRLPVGRRNNADPKWLVPLICRLGHVTKKDIGQIRIFDNETKFEIATDAPGFAIDEPLNSLGEALKLPEWYEPNRTAIEESLAPLELKSIEKVR